MISHFVTNSVWRRMKPLDRYIYLVRSKGKTIVINKKKGTLATIYGFCNTEPEHETELHAKDTYLLIKIAGYEQASPTKISLTNVFKTH